jgi:hypothetical protein
MPLPPWIAEHPHKDNWLSVARLRQAAEAAGDQDAGTPRLAEMFPDEEHHIF